MAKSTAVDVFVMQSVTLAALGPTIEALLPGRSFGPFEVQPRYSEALVFRSADRRFLAVSVLRALQAGKAHQMYFMGSSPRNYRIVFVTQPGIAP